MINRPHIVTLLPLLGFQHRLKRQKDFYSLPQSSLHAGPVKIHMSLLVGPKFRAISSCVPRIYTVFYSIGRAYGFGFGQCLGEAGAMVHAGAAGQEGAWAKCLGELVLL